MTYPLPAWACEDPEDRAVRLAHGFASADYDDGGALCRYGCRLTYGEVASGKILGCEGNLPRSAECPDCRAGECDYCPGDCAHDCAAAAPRPVRVVRTQVHRRKRKRR